MSDIWLDEWMQDFSEKFHLMEDYQGQTEFLDEEDYKIFNLAKEFFMATIGNLIKKNNS
tara:strand:- start:1704 stop:1880 length:177 start_codon:yes stop_codon:yes gene_type:complete